MPARKKDSNKTKDMLQHTKYRNVLGKEVPRSFDKWQELKYNDKERYAELKKAYRYVNANPGADMNAYKCVCELKEKFPKGSFHIPAKNIDTDKLAFDDEHINKQRNHNVTEKEAKEFINEAVMSRTKRNGLTENYYSEVGIVYVNPIENKIMTAFKQKEFMGEAVDIMEVLKKYGY